MLFLHDKYLSFDKIILSQIYKYKKLLMKFNIRIILLTCLILLLVIIYFSNVGTEHSKEKFSNITENNNFQNILDLKKSKTMKKSKSSNNNDYGYLEVKTLSGNPIYDKLEKYVKKYDTNLIYNLNGLNPNIPLVITYDNQSVRNEKNESFVNFLKGLNHYKYNFIVCGINTKWDGWYGRYLTYLELLDNIPPTQLIFVTDSRDVLVNDSPTEFAKNYDKLRTIYNDDAKNKIIFGTEIGCCVNQMWHYSPGSVFFNISPNAMEDEKNKFANEVIGEKNKSIMGFKSLYQSKSITPSNLIQIETKYNNSNYNSHSTYSLERANNIFPNGKEFPWEHWIKWNNLFKKRFTEAKYKYQLDNVSNNSLDDAYPIIKLNFGMLVGTCFNVLKMLRTFDLRAGEDDQHLASEFFYARPEMVILDYTQILLSNTGYKHSFRKCTAKTMNNTHYNVNFNDHLNEHDEYVDMNVYTREDIPERGIMYGFDIQNLKYFFTYDKIISFPCFIQSPGKDWNCYNELLYRLPYCDDKMCSYYYNLEQTQKYNIRDIITHEYKNQSGDMKIEWLLHNILNPLYWALNLYIVNDIYQITKSLNLADTFVLIDSGNLLGYYRFENLPSQHVMPWDDDFDLGWYSKNKFKSEQIEDFFKEIIKKGYEIFIYYKEIYTPYSSSEKDHFTIRLSAENILQIPTLLSRYEIVLFNVAIGVPKYKEILKMFNMNLDFEEKYVDSTIKIPSVDIFMYEFNPETKSYEYNKLFGAGYKISLPEKYVVPIKNIKYNNVDVSIPANTKEVLNIVYTQNFSGSYSKLDTIVIKRHTGSNDDANKNEMNKFNDMNLTSSDKNILLITKIYNNFVNKYFEIVNSNETIKKIILTG